MNTNNNTNNVKPHDVEITIKYHDGTHIQAKVAWAMIQAMKSLHGMSAVETAYNTTLENSTGK